MKSSETNPVTARPRELMSMDADALREMYRNREMEPEGAPDDWTPVVGP